jgi:hypothetical protein
MSSSSNDSKKYIDSFTSTVYNVNTSHPLIPNSQEYIFYKKYVSIHSEDRDVLKYPTSSEFEIELPEDYLNVSAIKLVQWTFPANYTTFSSGTGNNYLGFQITNPYNPGQFSVSNDLSFRIFEALYNSNKDYLFIIEDGFYNPIQMSTELTNKFNFAVTERITNYFKKQIIDNPGDGWELTLEQFILVGGYNRFIVVYNNVSLNLWFGNRADGFKILNEISKIEDILGDICTRQRLPDFSSYGLPSYLGLTKCNQDSISSFPSGSQANLEPNFSITYSGKEVPRFYYGDVTPGDNGYWLLPLDLSGCQVHWIEAPYKLNIMGDAFLYMELNGHNCIDETKPYNISRFTFETNQTNGVVNSAFAKLAVPSTPLSQWFDRDSVPYKLYYPPAERIRRLRIRIRYHNGQLASFGVFNFSFMLEFTLQVPQILRTSNSIVVPPPMGR